MFVCSLPPKVLLLAPLQLDSELVFSNYVATDSGNGMTTADRRRDRVQPERSVVTSDSQGPWGKLQEP